MEQIIPDYQVLMEDLRALIERLKNLKARIDDPEMEYQVAQQITVIEEAFDCLEWELNGLRNKNGED